MRLGCMRRSLPPKPDFQIAHVRDLESERGSEDDTEIVD